MWTRRSFLSRTGLGLFGLAGSALAIPGDIRDQVPDGSQAKGMVTDEAERAIKRGLHFLERSQDQNGSFGTGQFRGNVAVTSLSALAFMAGGHLPGRGTYNQVVSKALNFVMNQEDRHIRGYLHYPNDRSHGPMYGHGFGTLFLAEVYGMVSDPDLQAELHEKLKRAVELILRSQNSEGGWRYKPEPHEADISVTICQIMALRSARNAGIFVPKSKVDKCVEYVKKCQDKLRGWFRYRLQDNGIDNQSFARTAAGVSALFAAGIYSGPEVQSALNYLTTRCRPLGRFPGRPDLYYFYGHYYAAQAMWTAGGEYWSEWFPAIRDELIDGQKSRGDGSWLDLCTHYGTAMACIILQIPNNYLPILQK